MAREVRIAAVQLSNTPCGETRVDRTDSNFRAAKTWLERAGESGADIACLGETFNVLGLTVSGKIQEDDVRSATDRTLTILGRVARRYHMYVVAPILGLIDGVIRNAALVLDRDGHYLGHYAKVHCTEGERASGVVPGEAWPTFNLDFGCVGVQICHDNSFPESARCLMLSGAEIIFWPHVMGGWGGEFMDILLRSPAIHNGIHHVPVCFGCDLSHAWRPGMLIGRSSVIGPDGTILADAGRHVGMALADVDLDDPRIAADFTRQGDYVWRIDMLNDRRPKTYTPIVQPRSRTAPVVVDGTQEETN